MLPMTLREALRGPIGLRHPILPGARTMNPRTPQPDQTGIKNLVGTLRTPHRRGKNCDMKHAFLFRESRKPNFRPGKIGQPAFSRLPPHRTLTRTSKIDAKTRNGHIRAAS
jgi:hypothetical protein